MGKLEYDFKIIKNDITETKIVPNLDTKFIKGMFIIMDFFIFILSFLISSINIT